MVERAEIFHEIPFKAAELKRIPKSYRGALIANNLAANNICLYWRLHVLLNYEKNLLHDVAKRLLVVNTLMITRLLSSAIVEQIDSTRDFLELVKNDPPDRFISKIREFKDSICNNAHYQVAIRLRNASTNHYDTNSLAELSELFLDDHEFQLFIHEFSGNSLAPFAEEIAIAGEFEHKRSKHTSFQRWQEWMKKSSMECMLITEQLNEKTFVHLMQSATARERKITMPSNMFFGDSTRLPILWEGHRSDGTKK
ncbi:hypothetical protein SAMN05216304_103469 [Bosea sp. OK403]|uniref:hypothetical protein n=1 Tax=Bosea sp. OK403 TaxID=1855286 RepID=UPI0008E64D89|nr:hypothetical protein [Bosea sp. OK403]SFI77573.1 hypothetical protein SAMN05216304_103469 [Bosea sp. OK403]